MAKSYRRRVSRRPLVRRRRTTRRVYRRRRPVTSRRANYRRGRISKAVNTRSGTFKNPTPRRGASFSAVTGLKRTTVTLPANTELANFNLGINWADILNEGVFAHRFERVKLRKATLFLSYVGANSIATTAGHADFITKATAWAIRAQGAAIPTAIAAVITAWQGNKSGENWGKVLLALGAATSAVFRIWNQNNPEPVDPGETRDNHVTASSASIQMAMSKNKNGAGGINAFNVGGATIKMFTSGSVNGYNSFQVNGANSADDHITLTQFSPCLLTQGYVFGADATAARPIDPKNSRTWIDGDVPTDTQWATFNCSLNTASNRAITGQAPIINNAPTEYYFTYHYKLEFGAIQRRYQ